MLQHLADGRVDLMMGRGNTGPVFPWFGQDIRDSIALAVENYALLRRLWREDVVDWDGRLRTLRCSASPLLRVRWTAYRRSSGTPPSAATRCGPAYDLGSGQDRTAAGREKDEHVGTPF